MKKYYIIIPVYNNLQMTKNCIESLRISVKENPPFIMVVVNDGSANDVTQYLRVQNDLRYLENPYNQGYLVTTNKGFEYALSQSDCQGVVLFNNDMLVSGNWLELLVNATEHYGISGYFGAGNVNIEALTHMEVNKLEFSCALITRAVCENVGLLDARFEKGYYSDDDYCLRAIKKGYTIGLVKNRCNAEHLCGATAGDKRKDSIEEGARQFLQKWQDDNHESVREFFKTSFYDSSKIIPEKTLVRLLRYIKKHRFYGYLREKKDYILTSYKVNKQRIVYSIPTDIVGERIIFIHIPRTAGSSMVQAGFKEVFGHVGMDWYLKRNQKFCNEAFKFAFVRNPWDRVYSAYHYLTGASLNAVDKAFYCKHLSGYSDFNDFVLNGLANKSVLSFMHFIPQYKFVCGQDNKLCIDFLGKYESINEDFVYVCKALKRPYSLKKVNASKRGDYRTAYSKDTEAIIRKLYARDIKLFEYEF